MSRRRNRFTSLNGLALALLLPWCFPSVAGAHTSLDHKLAKISVAIELDPTSADLYLERAELHRKAADYDAAFEDLATASKLSADPFAIDVLRADMMIIQGRPEQARPILDSLVSEEPEFFETRELRARALAQLGKPSAAADDYLVAISLVDQASPVLYLELTRNLRTAGRLEEGLEQAERGLSALPRQIDLHLEAVAIEVELGKIEAALARLESEARRSLLPERLLFPRAQLLEQLGRLTEAHDAYVATVKLIRTRPRAWALERFSSMELEAHQGLERIARSLNLVTD